MKMGASCVGVPPPSPSVVCFFFCVHTLLSLSSSSSLARAFSEGDTHSFPPQTTGHPTPAGSSAFLFCALGLASCCVLLCRVRDLCHTECKYMSKHAKHFTDHDMSRHTHMHKASICVTYKHIYTHLCMCACVQMGSLAIVCRHDMCALLMQRPKHSRSSNKPHMNGIHFDRLRRILMNRGQMNVYAWCAIIKCFRLMRMFRKLPAKTVK